MNRIELVWYRVRRYEDGGYRVCGPGLIEDEEDDSSCYPDTARGAADAYMQAETLEVEFNCRLVFASMAVAGMDVERWASWGDLVSIIDQLGGSEQLLREGIIERVPALHNGKPHWRLTKTALNWLAETIAAGDDHGQSN